MSGQSRQPQRGLQGSYLRGQHVGRTAQKAYEYAEMEERDAMRKRMAASKKAMAGHQKSFPALTEREREMNKGTAGFRRR